MKHLKIYNKQDVLSFTSIRKYETKLGERVQVIHNTQDIHAALQQSTAKFVLFGVSENIGIKANYGYVGSSHAWLSFLRIFLNIQSNDFFDGREILVLGNFDFSDVENVIDANAHQFEEKIEAWRHAVNMIDDEVEKITQIITQYKKLPIVIGGGHNNAYPCIKGSAKGWYKAGVIDLPQLNAINLDAYADYTATEGRHSGNAFRYAEEDGFLKKYCVIGLHENNIQQNVWIDMVNNPFVDCITFEDIFIHKKRNFIQSIAHATAFTDDTLVGIELDMNCIESVNSKTNATVGISPLHARQYVNYITYDSKPAYFHICQGTTLTTGEQLIDTNAQLISFLVSDFIKGVLQQLT
jgi:formiminoglutamase